MAHLRHAPRLLAGLVVLVASPAGRADAPANPLRLVPADAALVAKIEHPRLLLETFTSLPAFHQAMKLQPVRDYYDSTNVRRLFQLLAYLEKRLGAGRLELLDRLAGGGVVVAVKAGADPAPTLLVVQGTDAKLLRDFLGLAEEIVGEELARQEDKFRLEKFSYAGTPGLRAGDKLLVAAAGTALLVSNHEPTLRHAIDQAHGTGQGLAGQATVAQALRLLPPRPLVWAWLNLEPIRKLEKVKEVVPTIELNPVLAPFVSSWIDAARRAPFLCAALAPEGAGFVATLRLPRGLDGMAPAAAVYLPTGHDAAPPLLEPRAVQFSSSYYLDLARLWANRDKVLTKEARDQLEKFEKNSGRFLGGTKLGKILGQAGSHQRLVSVIQPRDLTVYPKRRPPQALGAFALVQEMRDPGFARSMDTVLRSAGVIATFQFNLKMVQEQHAGCTLVSYRFPEDGTFPGDATGIRFGFSPTFTKVGDQFVVSSTVELARELVDLLQKEQGRKATAASSVRMRLYASGLAAQLRQAREQLVAQSMLGQALSPAQAQRQYELLLRLAEGLGNLDIESTYEANRHRLDVRFSLGRGPAAN